MNKKPVELNVSFHLNESHKSEEFRFKVSQGVEIRVLYSHYQRFVYFFKFYGAVNMHGFESLTFERGDLKNFSSPLTFAELTAKQLYETEGKKYQKELLKEQAEKNQLMLF
jgi:hypothetical protein